MPVRSIRANQIWGYLLEILRIWKLSTYLNLNLEVAGILLWELLVVIVEPKEKGG